MKLYLPAWHSPEPLGAEELRRVAGDAFVVGYDQTRQSLPAGERDDETRVIAACRLRLERHLARRDVLLEIPSDHSLAKRLTHRFEDASRIHVVPLALNMGDLMAQRVTADATWTWWDGDEEQELTASGQGSLKDVAGRLGVGVPSTFPRHLVPTLDVLFRDRILQFTLGHGLMLRVRRVSAELRCRIRAASPGGPAETH